MPIMLSYKTLRHAGRGRVKLVAGGSDILETSPPGQRAAARSVLSGKGISVITDGLVLLPSF